MICYDMICYDMLCYHIICYHIICYDMICYEMICYDMTGVEAHAGAAGRAHPPAERLHLRRGRPRRGRRRLRHALWLSPGVSCGDGIRTLQDAPRGVSRCGTRPLPLSPSGPNAKLGEFINENVKNILFCQY